MLRELIWKLKEKFNNDLEIISRGSKFGVDKIVKEICNLNGILYSEFIPRFNTWNPNCVEEKYFFNKKYNPKYFYINNKNFLDYCDYIFLYINKIEDSEILKQTNKLNPEKNKKIATIFI